MVTFLTNVSPKRSKFSDPKANDEFFLLIMWLLNDLRNVVRNNLTRIKENIVKNLLHHIAQALLC